MKNQLTAGLLLLLLALATGCDRHSEPARPPADVPPPVRPATLSSFDASSGTNGIVPANMIRFQDADLAQVLELYQELSGRTLIRSPQVPMNAKISFHNAAPLTRVEALQMMDNVFAAHQIVMVYLGAQYVKVVPMAGAPGEAAPVVEGPWQRLPESSSFVSYIVKLKTLAPEEAVPLLQPFAKLPNSIIATRGSGVLILRDYSSNVRRMMEVLEKVDGDPNRPNKGQ